MVPPPRLQPLPQPTRVVGEPVRGGQQIVVQGDLVVLALDLNAALLEHQLLDRCGSGGVRLR